MFTERLICSWIGALGLAAGAFAQSYIPIPKSTEFPLEIEYLFPQSINDGGVIAGSYWASGVGPIHGFVRAADGTITSFDAPGSDFQTFASSINDDGAITGYYVGLPFTGQGLTNHGYIRDPFGNFTTFDPPNSISTIPRRINAGGDVTGYYRDLNNVIHGFVRHDVMGKLISFDPPGSIQTTALDINQKGEITGFYLDADHRTHGFLRRAGGAIVSFDPPESAGTMATGINNAGAITGVYTANGRGLGFVRQAGGKIVSFDVPGSLGIFGLPLSSMLTSGLSINDEGAITGSYSDNSGVHGFGRSPEGMITSFDPPFEPTSCLPSPFLANSVAGTFPTSINDNGVITGWCETGIDDTPWLGWVRYP